MFLSVISRILALKKTIATILLILFTTTAYSNELNFWAKKNVPSPQNYIFGYGSLVNAESRAASFNCMQSVVAARISAEFGYKRVWNYKGPGFTALGLQKTDSPMSINGIIYSVHADDMSVWDQREKYYNRIELPWTFVESVDWMNLPKDGKLWVYIPKAHYLASPSHPLIQSYIDICVTGFLDYGEAFAVEFLQTTDNWSMYWLNDRLVARRPWVHFKPHTRVDNLLEQYPSKNNVFHLRSFVSEWRVQQPICPT